MDMYKEIRSNVIDKLVAAAGKKHGVAFLEGGKQTTRYEAGKGLMGSSSLDTDVLFRQDSKFHYLFGVKEPDFYGAIETDTKKSILFIPQYVAFCGCYLVFLPTLLSGWDLFFLPAITRICTRWMKSSMSMTFLPISVSSSLRSST